MKRAKRSERVTVRMEPWLARVIRRRARLAKQPPSQWVRNALHVYAAWEAAGVDGPVRRYLRLATDVPRPIAVGESEARAPERAEANQDGGGGVEGESGAPQAGALPEPSHPLVPGEND